MLPIITPRQARESVDCVLFFAYLSERGAGYAFPCDAAGTVDVGQLAPAGRSSLAACRDGVGREFRAPVVREDRIRWVQPAVARCRCGSRVTLDGDSECERCGRMYNSAGQELMPESAWEE